MGTSSRVLIVDRHAKALRGLPGLLRKSGSSFLAETTASITEAVARVSKAGYDAVLCQVDGPEDVSFVIRIKHANPRVPVVALTSGADPALEDLAWESGADHVQSPDAEAVRRRTVGIQKLIDRTRAVLARSRELRMEGRDLVAQHRRLVARRRILSENRIEQIQRVFGRFLPLLVEDEKDQAFLTQQAFERARFPFSLPVLKDGGQAIDYLSGKKEFADRSRFPLPTLVLLDQNLPWKSGLEVLQWIRSRGEFRELPVFMLTTSPDHFDQALALGATDYYRKPLQFRELVDIVRQIAVRWWFLQQAGEARA